MVWASVGCVSESRRGSGEGPAVARFYLETGRDGGASATLPRSEVTISILPKPVITEFDLTGVEIADVELGRCLMFQLTPAASRDLLRLTASHVGWRLVLLVNGQPLGARRIESAIHNGALLIFVEQSDDALPQLTERLRETVAMNKGTKR